MVVLDRGNDNIDLRYGRFGFTIPGAANAISETYAIPEPEVRYKIIEAVCSGDLRIRNQYGYPYQSGDVDMQNDRISVEDLNKFHSERGMPYLLSIPLDAEGPADTKSAAKVESIKGIPKQAVISAFEGLHFNQKQWSRSLASPPDWLKGCRVAKGNKKTSATWNPILIAIKLTDLQRGVSMRKLDAVFVGLKDWTEKWQVESEFLR